MSDDKGSTGNFDDVVSAQISKTWEARLEEARKQRAAALGQKPKPTRKEKSTERPPATTHGDPGKPDAEPAAPMAAPPVFKSQNRHRTTQSGHRSIAVVLASMFAGGILYWLGSSVLSYWNSDSETAVAEQRTSAIAALSVEDSPPKAKSVLSQAAVRDTIQSEPNPDRTADLSPNEPGIFEPPILMQAPTMFAAPTNVSVRRPSEYQAHGPPPALQTFSLPLHEQTVISDGITEPASQPPDDSQDQVFFFGPYLPDSETASIDPTIDGAVTAQNPEADIEVSLFVPAQVSGETSEKAMKVLTDGQANILATARVGYSIRETQVRYYHRNDAEMAVSVAGALGGISRDFTNAGQKTRPGHIEVYLAGRGGRSTAQASAEETRFEQFIERLLQELQ